MHVNLRTAVLKTLCCFSIKFVISHIDTSYDSKYLIKQVSIHLMIFDDLHDLCDKIQRRRSSMLFRLHRAM